MSILFKKDYSQEGSSVFVILREPATAVKPTVLFTMFTITVFTSNHDQYAFSLALPKLFVLWKFVRWLFFCIIYWGFIIVHSVIAIPKSLSYSLITDHQGTSAHLRLPAIAPIEVHYKYTLSTMFFWNKLCTNMNIEYVNRYIHAFSLIMLSSTRFELVMRCFIAP